MTVTDKDSVHVLFASSNSQLSFGLQPPVHPTLPDYIEQSCHALSWRDVHQIVVTNEDRYQGHASEPPETLPVTIPINRLAVSCQDLSSMYGIICVWYLASMHSLDCNQVL